MSPYLWEHFSTSYMAAVPWWGGGAMRGMLNSAAQAWGCHECVGCPQD